MAENEFVPYIAKVRAGNSQNALEITIPARIVEYMGLQAGNNVDIRIKKLLDEVKQEEEEKRGD